jgi:predicted nucleotidyltransferase
MSFPGKRSILAYSNTQKVTVIGSFHIKGEGSMKFKIQLVTSSETGEEIQELVCLEREAEVIEGIGITLVEAKTLLAAAQKQIVDQQIAAYLASRQRCPQCGRSFRHKDHHPLIFRTLFGNLELSSPRWHKCSCQPHKTNTFSPLTILFPERCSPERMYLETKWASLVSFELAAQMLEDVFPTDTRFRTTSVRNHLRHVANRAEATLGKEQLSFIDGCPYEWARLPRPPAPLTVGIDGGYVRQWDNKKTHFEVIVGKSIPEEGDSKCFGLVQSYDAKPKRRLFEVLKGQGMQFNQQITFLSDGGETVRNLQLYLNPEAEHLLDWFHITMRLTVLKQTAKGLPMAISDEDDEKYDLREPTLEILKSIKWYLWHGNTYEALQHLEKLEMDLYAADMGSKSSTIRKLLRMVEEFHTYIANNRSFITNYGQRYHQGDRISTGFVESVVNYVIAKRFTKKQQMQWSPEGAHLLLQMRTRVLNGELEQTFREWYPGFRIDDGGVAPVKPDTSLTSLLFF